MSDFRKEEDGALVALAQGGDKSATEELLRRYAGLVRSHARRYFLVGGETEDLIQEGMIGLYSAIIGYDCTRTQGSFKGFADVCVSRQIFDAIKKVYSKKSGVLHNAQPLDTQMVETGLSPEEQLILVDEQKEFRQRMSKELSDFEFKIMTRYIDGLTIVEICEETGKTYKSVDNAIQRSKNKLLRFLKK